jgi:RNA polymerase sigma factor (sigma-70 family)
VEHYLPDLVAYVRKNAGQAIVAHESATDIAHSACREILAKLTGQRHAYTDEAHFRAWLFQAALRKIQDRARYWGREKRDPARLRSLAAGEDRLLDDVTVCLTPSELTMAKDDHRRLAQALDKLEPRQREIVRMAHESQMSHKEIAAVFRIEESHSRTLLARALARLARLMAE